jgi:Galactosyltransferase
VLSAQLQAVQHLFVVGRSNDATVISMLQLETQQYRDILRGEFFDTALKTPIFRWVLQRIDDI